VLVLYTVLIHSVAFENIYIVACRCPHPASYS